MQELINEIRQAARPFKALSQLTESLEDLQSKVNTCNEFLTKHAAVKQQLDEVVKDHAYSIEIVKSVKQEIASLKDNAAQIIKDATTIADKKLADAETAATKIVKDAEASAALIRKDIEATLIECNKEVIAAKLKVDEEAKRLADIKQAISKFVG